MDKDPLCVYATETVPENALHISKVDRCVAHAIFTIANVDGPIVYLGDEHLGGCCPGGQFWLGYTPPPKGLEFFVSTGSPTYRNGAAEYYKRDPEIARQSIARVGKMTPPGKFVVIAPYHREVKDGRILSILCFGHAENVRNLIGLAEFGSDDPFGTCVVPWGAACASIITYASGIAESGPKGALIVGPTDPMVNEWLPSDIMTLSIPIATAERMANDIESSFLTKRPKVAFPEKHDPT